MKRISDLEKKYANEVLDNQFRTSLNGLYVKKLEEQFSKKFRSKFSISHANGTATMHTALAALGVKEGDEVIVPPLTMSSTALAVLHNSSIPIFADVDIKTFNIDPNSIKKCITEKTKAIITVSLYGLSPDYDQILKICKEKNLYLIEDNAECFLGYYKNKIVGSFGDFSSFSFQASKHVTCGEGGMLITNDESLADKARQFSSLGYAAVSSRKGKISKEDIQDPNYNRHTTLGFNYRISDISAAVALGQIERIDELVSQRIKIAELYRSAIKEFSFVDPQYNPVDCVNSFWCYSIVLKTKNINEDWYKFREIFKKNGGDHYYAAWKLSYQEPLFSNIIQSRKKVWQNYKDKLCPSAEYLQPRLIQLKTNYWDLTHAEYQAELLNKSLSEFGG